MQSITQDDQPLRLLSCKWCWNSGKPELKFHMKGIWDNGWVWDHTVNQITNIRHQGHRNLNMKAISSQPVNLPVFLWAKAVSGPPLTSSLYISPIKQGCGKCEARDKAKAASLLLRSMSSLLDRWPKHSRAGSFSKGVKSYHMGPRRLSPRSKVTSAPCLPTNDTTAPDWVSPGQVGTISDWLLALHDITTH